MLSRAEIEMPENILDVVLLKKDGTPTYHFAHVVERPFNAYNSRYSW